MTMLDSQRTTEQPIQLNVVDVPVQPGVANALQKAVNKGDIPRPEAAALAVRLAEGTPALSGTTPGIESQMDRVGTDDGLTDVPATTNTVTAPLKENSVRLLTDPLTDEPVSIATTSRLPNQAAPRQDLSAHRAKRGTVHFG